MKLVRLALATLVISALAACSSDVTGPTPGAPSYDEQGTLGTPT